MTMETKQLKTIKDLKGTLVNTKVAMEKVIEESSEQFAKTMVMLETGVLEHSEEVETVVIGSIINGKMALAVIETINAELEILDEIIKENEEASDEEITEEEVGEIISALAGILGFER